MVSGQLNEPESRPKPIQLVCFSFVVRIQPEPNRANSNSSFGSDN